jgi:hypothetical protein
MSRAEREAAIERIRDSDPKDLSADDWKTLAGIIGDDADQALTAGLPRAIGRALPIRDLALNVGFQGPAWNTTSSRLFSGHMNFDAWRASTIPLAQRQARVTELLGGSPLEKTRDDWRELTALLHTDGIDVTEHSWFPGIRLDLATRHAYVSGYEAASEALVRAENASPAQLDAARRELLGTGELGALASAVVDREQLELVGLTGAAASAVRLRHSLPTNPSTAKSWMLDVQRELRSADVSGPVTTVRDEALALIDRNLARIEGERWWIPRDGYANHPDYAELGRVRSSFQLLEKVGAIKLGDEAAPVVDDGVERLTW